MSNYYVLAMWYDANDSFEAAYYTVTMLGEDRPRYVNVYHRPCFDWASNRARFVNNPGDLRMDAEDYLIFGIYSDTGEIDGMRYEVMAVFRLED